MSRARAFESNVRAARFKRALTGALALLGDLRAHLSLVEELASVTREYVEHHGAHPGPCTNEDDPEAACELHLEASEQRRERVRRALRTYDRSVGKLTRHDPPR